MLSAALSIGATGLRSMQAVVDTHTTNIANAETPGYRRRDSVLSELSNGGVSQAQRHRFSETTATRISQLAGAAEASATFSDALVGVQSQLSEASTQLAGAQTDFRTALSTTALEPGNSTARTLVAEKATALARIANAHLQELGSRIEDEQVGQANAMTAADGKLDELAALNRAVLQTGATPDLKDRQAQVGRELAELIGGEVSFTSSGLAEFTVSGTKVLSPEGKQDLPETLGGKVAGHVAARTELTRLRDTFSAGLQAFAAEVNGLNAQGADAQGQPGGALFVLRDNQFSFEGTAQAVALGPLTNANGSVADRMARIGSLAEMTGEVATQAASRTSLAQTVSEVEGMALGNLEQKHQTEEGVDVDYELIGMKNAQRAYEANAKVIQVADAMLGTLLSIKV